MPIGSDAFVVERLRALATDVEGVVDAALPFVRAFPREGLALMQCSVLQRLTWLYRNVEPRLVISALGARLRAMQLRIVEAAAGRRELPLLAQRIMRLPKSLGPVGVVDPLEASTVDYTANALDAMSLVTWITPQLVAGFESSFENCREFGGLLASTTAMERRWFRDPDDGALERAQRDKKGVATRDIMTDPSLVMHRRADGRPLARQRLQSRLMRGVGITQRARLIDDTRDDSTKVLIAASALEGAALV